MRKGFTLIELLVVIAIIAILAMILFPVFAKARESAKISKCVAHGRQVGTATLMYMNDNNGRFPTPANDQMLAAANKQFGGSAPYNWGGREYAGVDVGMAQWRFIQLRPYVKNDDIWICPDPHTMYAKRYAYVYRISWLPRTSDTWGQGFVDGDRGFVKDTDKGGIGLSIEEVMANDADPNNDCGVRYMPPSKKIMWMCYALGEWANGVVGSRTWPWVFPSYAHRDGSTFVYADGHAAWKRMGKGWAPIRYTNMSVDRAPDKNEGI